MNGYTTFFLVAIGVLDLVTSEENYSDIDNIEYKSQEYNLRSYDKLRANKSDFGKDEHRKSRFYQYYRVKKLRGKTSFDDGNINGHVYQRKEPHLERKDKDVYNQNISFVHNYLGNETSSNYERGDTRSEYPDGKLNDVMVNNNNKQLKDSKRLKEELRNTDFHNVRNFKYYKFNNKHGKTSNAGITRYDLKNYLAIDREHITNEDINSQVIYIRKNKNVQYMKKIPNKTGNGKDRKLQPSNLNIKNGQTVTNNRNFVNFDGQHILSNHFKETQNKSNQSNNDQYDERREKNDEMQVNKDKHETKNFPFLKLDDNQLSNGFNSSSKKIFNYVEVVKNVPKLLPAKHTWEKNYRYLGMTTNIQYHRDRNNRNNSRPREIINSYHSYHDPSLENDDFRKFSSESKEYSKGNIYSENLEPERGYISPNEIRKEEKSTHHNKLKKEPFDRKFRFVSNGIGNYMRRFEQKTYERHNDKSESMKVLDINTDKIRNYNHSGSERSSEHNSKLGNRTREHSRLRKSMTNRNINWLRRNPEKQYFGAFDSDNVTPIEYQNSFRNVNSTYYPLEPTNNSAEIQSSES